MPSLRFAILLLIAPLSARCPSTSRRRRSRSQRRHELPPPRRSKGALESLDTPSNIVAFLVSDEGR